ncbi:uncharacterized protein LOC128958875 [Oppia nitens]|uniref:uncharacterized protein LOC128958875 n=1 Tax=Oppia nitens TaxID=1686743 RepID=UPI0023DBEFB5|nr:uncharacterized protein LOC128958875 [Oppia nitens]
MVTPFIWTSSAMNATVGDVRQKIVFLQDFAGGGGQQFGLDYRSFDTQDDYEVKTIFNLYEKWLKVKRQLMNANKRNVDSFYINYLSGRTPQMARMPLLVMPYFVAGGRSDHRTNSPLMLTGRTTLINRDVFPDFPRVYCLGSFCLVAFEGTNDLTLNFIQNERPNYVGILMMDFPGDALIDAIIRLNRSIDKTIGDKNLQLLSSNETIHQISNDSLYK